MKSLSPNHFGKIFLVEECQKLSINETIKIIQPKIKEQLLKTEISSQNLSIAIGIKKTGVSGLRYWFICPICNKYQGVLYVHPISQILACRDCLGLKYKKRRYHKMVENN
jgi:hypothetical protein